MNAIQGLKAHLQSALPGAQLDLDVPADPSSGIWFLDVAGHGRHVAIQWQPGKDAFGISLVTEDTGLGEPPDEWLPTQEAAAKRVADLLGVPGTHRRSHLAG